MPANLKFVYTFSQYLGLQYFVIQIQVTTTVAKTSTLPHCGPEIKKDIYKLANSVIKTSIIITNMLGTISANMSNN
jgi:hypothetical protein